jgi:hypothetical protein
MVKKKKNREPKAKKKKHIERVGGTYKKKNRGTIELSFITPATEY